MASLRFKGTKNEQLFSLAKSTTIKKEVKISKVQLSFFKTVKNILSRWNSRRTDNTIP